MTTIKLPPLPNFRDWPYTHEELRARDLEVARVVLEAALRLISGAVESERMVEYQQGIARAALGDKT